MGCAGRLPGSGDDGVIDDDDDDAGTPDAGALDGDAGTDGGVDAGFIDAGGDAGSDDASDAGANGDDLPVFVNWWGGFGTDPGEFIEPSSVDIDENGVVIVAGHENRVQRFTRDGEPLEIWGVAGAGDGQFNHPHGLAVDDDRDLVYVGDQENHRLQVFTLTGEFVRQWGDAQFAHIHDIGIDHTTGDVLVGDYELDTLRKFSSSGELLAEYGGSGAGPSEFNGVWGIDADSNRNIYIADTHNQRVKKLSPIAAVDDIWTGFDGTTFQKPTGVFVDVNDTVYVCDSLAQMVYLFDVDGAPLDRWDLAAIYGELSEPEDIVVTADGRDIYIGEVANHRVLHLMRAP
jgi:DNA-binding beta-propeller fold protein YncE